MAAHTILIVDDAHDHRDILSRLLRATGYRVIESEPGEKAISQAENETPDLILTALSLPGQPTWETTRALRALPSLSDTPILGATLLTTLLTHHRVRALGCIDFVDKPFDLDGLLDRIRELLPNPPQTALAA